ncbi:MAG: uroporphyrinogen-III synthase, partial [Bacteroidia bacterium]|nr:uroporphyrinogen-III synthase [Bacteroidia bacterium]
MKVKSILVTQPKPESDKSPYFDLAQKYQLKIDFRPFIHIEGIEAKEFRKDRISILDHTAVILTSRSAADHYFRICNEMRISVPESMKYFCVSESTAYYLQKYVQFRKRKIFNGKQTFHDLAEIIKKHSGENFLLPCSDIHKDEISDFLDRQNIRYSRAVIFKTVSSNIQDLKNVNYDILVFFSPMTIKSLYKNFPSFKQNQTRIAALGPATAKAIKDAGLKLNIYAPSPQAPSMTMAIENYIK